VQLALLAYKLLLQNAYLLEHTDANHHYTPSTGLIVEYARGVAPRSVSVKKEAACEPNLYTFRDKATKQPSDFIENQMFAHSLEKYASRIIHELQDASIVKLTPLEESILALFVSFQYVRTPKFFAWVRVVLEYLHIEKSVPIDAMLGKDFYRQVFFENIYNLSPKEVAAFAVKKKVAMSGAENLIHRIAWQIGNDLGEIIYRYDLHFLTATPPAFFYLSDSPTELFSVASRNSVGPFMWRARDQMLVSLPVSPSLCIYYLPRGSKNNPGAIGLLLEQIIPDSIYQKAYYSVDSSAIRAHF
jgi:hypothetical protein